jgi:hypothetical protein
MSFDRELSDSKYITAPVGLDSRKFLQIERAKNVFPVASSPANAIIRFEGRPAKIEPERRALRA